MAFRPLLQKASSTGSYDIFLGSTFVQRRSGYPAHQVSLPQLPKESSDSNFQLFCSSSFTLRSRFLRVKGSNKQSFIVAEVLGGSNSRISASLASSDVDSGEDSIVIAGRHVPRADVQIMGAALITILLSVSNKVLYKMALVPLKNYPFFLAQVTTFGYVLVYFSILYFRYCMGAVTNEMLNLPKHHFIALGAVEAMGLAIGMAATAMLPGASMLVLYQVYLVWQLLLSYLFLKKHYAWGQVGGCFLVLLGVVIVISCGGSRPDLNQTSYFWSLLMIVSTGFSAAGTILKEFVFQNATRHIKGAPLDLFVVNSFGSGFQALFVLLLLPILSRLRGIPFSQLPSYMGDASACFINVGSSIKGCEGAPLVPLLYIIANMSFNISALNLLKMSSALVASLSTTLSVPFSIWLFTLPLPYLGTPAEASPGLLWGALVLVLGLALYHVSSQGRSLPDQN